MCQADERAEVSNDSIVFKKLGTAGRKVLRGCHTSFRISVPLNSCIKKGTTSASCPPVQCTFAPLKICKVRSHLGREGGKFLGRGATS